MTSEFERMMSKYDGMLGKASRIKNEAIRELNKDKLVSAFDLYEQYIDEFSTALPMLKERFPEKFHHGGADDA